MSIEGLVALVVWLIVIGLIFFVIPEPFNKVARVAVAVIGALIVIYVLLGLLPPLPRLR